MRSSEFEGRCCAPKRGPGRVHLFVSQRGHSISSANSMFSSLCSVISDRWTDDRCNAQARPPPPRAHASMSPKRTSSRASAPAGGQQASSRPFSCGPERLDEDDGIGLQFTGPACAGEALRATRSRTANGPAPHIAVRSFRSPNISSRGSTLFKHLQHHFQPTSTVVLPKLVRHKALDPPRGSRA